MTYIIFLGERSGAKLQSVAIRLLGKGLHKVLLLMSASPPQPSPPFPKWRGGIKKKGRRTQDGRAALGGIVPV